MNSETEAVSDGFGNLIEVGDTIVYATRKGSSTYLNKMLVKGVENGGVFGYLVTDPTRFQRRLKNLQTTHVVERGADNVDQQQVQD